MTLYLPIRLVVQHVGACRVQQKELNSVSVEFLKSKFYFRHVGKSIQMNRARPHKRTEKRLTN